MWVKALIILTILLMAVGVSAQTVGPTPTDYPPGYSTNTPAPDLIWTASPMPPTPTWFFPTLDFYGQAIYLASPTPLASVTPMPTISSGLNNNQVYNYLATAAANVNALPDQLDQPGGVAVLPDADAVQIFAYAKWLWSGASTQELLGTTLSPLANSAFVWISLIIVVVTVYLTLKVAITIIKFVVWLIQQALRVIPFIG